MVPEVEAQKQRSWLAIFAGALLVFAGVRAMTTSGLLVAPILVGSGVWIVGRGATRLLRLHAYELEEMRRIRAGIRDDFRRASLPRRIFLLLLAIAEVDGKRGDAERELVRRFLLTRFADPATIADLRAWEAFRLQPQQVRQLCAELRETLSRVERETLFHWCCLITLVDRRFDAAERSILQDVAKGLGLAPDVARQLFLHAKQSVLRDDARNGAGRTETGSGGDAGARRPRSPSTPRAEALELLNLPADATPDQIRKRHRELVREHHPDAHAHLGPVAAAEATERFREIQRAYEVLVSARRE